MIIHRTILGIFLLCSFEISYAKSTYGFSLDKFIKSSDTIIIGFVSKIDSPNRHDQTVFILQNATLYRKGEISYQANYEFKPISGQNGSDLRIEYLNFPEVSNVAPLNEYIFFLDSNGNINEHATFIISEDQTVRNNNNIPVVIDEFGDVRLSKLEYDLSGVQTQLLKYSEGGNDRVLYYSNAKPYPIEKPSNIREILDGIGRNKLSQY